MEKWGLVNDMELCKFRFNQGFNMFNIERFLKDLLNSAEFRASMPAFGSKLSTVVDSVKFEKLSTEVINMGFFDIL